MAEKEVLRPVEAAIQKYEEAGLELQSMVFSLTENQRRILRVLLVLAEPTTTSNLRFTLIKWLACETDEQEKKTPSHLRYCMTYNIEKVRDLLIPKLQNKKIKVPSYDKVESELKSLEDKGFVFKQSEPSGNPDKPKHVWALNPQFVKEYLRVKGQLAKEGEKVKFTAHPDVILEFFGVAEDQKYIAGLRRI